MKDIKSDHEFYAVSDRPEKRSGVRHKTVYRIVHLQAPQDEGLALCINISDGGAALQLSAAASVGDEVRITFSPSAALVGEIVWQKEDQCGIKFLEPVDSAELLASTATEAQSPRSRPLRLNVHLPARLLLDGRTYRTTICDISQRGVKLTHDGVLRPLLMPEILLSTGLRRTGEVRWVKGDHAGIYLATPITIDSLGSIARLSGKAQG